MQSVKLETVCGAPLYVVEMPHVQSVAMGVLVFAGTRDETWPAEAGLAHAHEHMVFRGNTKFPVSEQVSGFIEKIGGEVNAWTNQEMTFFYNIVPANHTERAVEYLYELLTHPLHQAEDIRIEMKAVIEEIKGRNDDPARLALDLAEGTAYGNHPLGKNTLGIAKSVKTFQSADFFRWHQDFYFPENFAFLVVGNAEAQAIQELFNRYFRDGSGKIKNARRLLFSAKSGKNRTVKKEIEQVNLALAAPFGAATDRSTLALELFQVMLDGGMSFPLFQEVREKHGLCYAVSADARPASDVGLFFFYVGSDPQKYEIARDTIFKVIKTSAGNQQLFREAKELLLGKTAIKYESPEAMLSKLAYDVALYGKPKLVQETLKEIRSVALEEVTEAVERYLNPQSFIQVLVAPKKFKI